MSNLQHQRLPKESAEEIDARHICLHLAIVSLTFFTNELQADLVYTVISHVGTAC